MWLELASTTSIFTHVSSDGVTVTQCMGRSLPRKAYKSRHSLTRHYIMIYIISFPCSSPVCDFLPLRILRETMKLHSKVCALLFSHNCSRRRGNVGAQLCSEAALVQIIFVNSRRQQTKSDWCCPQLAAQCH